MAREASFTKALFHGVVSEELIFPYPRPDPREHETLTALRRRIEELAGAADWARMDREQRIPGEVFGALREAGLFGLGAPKDLGGLGLSHTGRAKVMEALARVDVSLAITVVAHHCLGLTGLLLFGSERQRRQYVPRLASGEWIAACALTEAQGGSDVANLQMRADLATDGEGYLLNGTKSWVTNGAVADLFTVFASVQTPGDGEPQRPTAFLVERGHGLRSGAEEPTLGARGASTTAVFLEDVKVPSRNILGPLGEGVEVAMRSFNDGRLGLAAACLGASKHAIDLAVRRALERSVFGRSLSDFEITREKLAQLMSEAYALECMTYLATGFVDAKVPDYSLESAICKVYAADVLWRAADTAVQIAGAEGYMASHPYERLLRDARLAPIFGGTNEVLRAFIALAGLQGPSTQRAELSKALREPVRGLGVLGEFALQRARSAFGRARLDPVHPALKREAALFEEAAAAMAKAADRALARHGAELPDRQFVQWRLADLAIDLFALAAVLACTTGVIQARGESGASREADLTMSFGALARARMERNLADLESDRDELAHRTARHALDARGYGQ
jgi:acyl-CoA dehydrogenase family member 9